MGNALAGASKVRGVTDKVVFAFGGRFLGGFNTNKNVVMGEVLHDCSVFRSNRGRCLIF